jgi:hypothetical protein
MDGGPQQIYCSVLAAVCNFLSPKMKVKLKWRRLMTEDSSKFAEC